MTTTSQRLKEAMKKRDMKQIDIVEKTGIDKGALSSYLSGKYKPKQTNLYLLAKALNVEVTWLMGYDVPMEPNSITTTAQLTNMIRKDPQAQKLLQYYYNLTNQNKERVLDLIEALSDKDSEGEGKEWPRSLEFFT